MLRWKCAALIILGLIFTAHMFTTLEIHNDSLQILDKVVKIKTTGEWTHYGNRGTGVGFVPGSFMTFVSAIPMQIYFSPYSAMAVIAIFHLLALFFLGDIARRIAPSVIILDLILLFWLNPWRVEQSELYNPAYLPLFSALHLWSAYKMKDKDFWLTFIHTLAIGFCAQVHYSAIILGFCSLFLFYFGFLRVNWLGFFSGCLVFLLSLIPYFLDYMANPDLAVTVADPNKAFLGRNFLYVYPVLKAVLYWLRYMSTYFGRHIFTEITFDWISTDILRLSIYYVFHTLKWALAATTLWFSIRWNWQLLKKMWIRFPLKKQKVSIPTEGRERFEFYLFYLFTAMVLSAGLSPVEFNHWHLILCFPPLSLFLSLKFQDLRKILPQKRMNHLFYSVLFVFCLFNLFMSLGSRSHSQRNNYHQDVLNHYKLPRF